MTLARPWQHPWAVVAGGISLRVRVTPRGGRDGVEGLVADPDGQPLVGIRVAAAPVDGDANDAVERLLAKWLGVPKTDVEITGGQSIRLKTVAIDGDPVQLIRRCQALVAAATPPAKP